MSSSISLRSVTGFIAIATLFVVFISSSSHTNTNDLSIDQSIEQHSNEPHSFQTKSVADDLYLITRPPTNQWYQVNTTIVPSEYHTFHWIFPSRNIDWVQAQLSVVSDPNSARYGGWLSKADVDAMTQPEASVQQPVLSWFIENGLTNDDWEHVGAMLTITAPISLIEHMFHTTMLAYALPKRNVSDHELDLNTMVIRSNGAVSIPSSLSTSLAHISGLSDFPAISELSSFNRTAKIQAMESGRRRRFALRQAFNTPFPCSSDYTIQPGASVAQQFLAQAYNYTSRQRSTTTPAQADRYPAIITGLTRTDLNECFTASDLNAAQTLLGYTAAPRLAPQASVCGANDAPTNQASSDITALYSIVPTTQLGSFYTPTNGDIAAIANMILNMPDNVIPAVVAYSYSSYTDTSPSVRAADAALAQLALRGVTFVVSSGVQGAVGPGNALCEESHPDAPMPGSYQNALLTAAYPASSPYVLSVGATDFIGGLSLSDDLNDYVRQPGQTFPNAPGYCGSCGGPAAAAFSCQTTLGPESAPNVFQPVGSGFTAGGGFANYDSGANLEWQRAVKERYVNFECDAQCLPERVTFSSARRGFPDVAAYGSYSPYVRSGQIDTQYILPEIITSVAAVWAGFITRMNEVSSVRMGYVNPYLYQMAQRSPATFNDIIIGSNGVSQDAYYFGNPAPSSDTTSRCGGYSARAGWDPLTGLGSPNLGLILEYVRNNPNIPVVVGDPTITGFHGHTMQVHGTSAEYYNLISTPNFQYNAQFVFLSEGACTAELKNRTECWSHAGTYLGELGVLIGGHGEPVVRVHVQAGSINEGLSVTVYDDQSETPSLLLEPSTDTFSHSLFTLTQSSPFTATLTMDEFTITWDNSDQFVNQLVQMQTRLDTKIEMFITQQQQHFKSINQSIKRSQVSPDHDTARQLPHGLLGQSWSERSYDNQWKWLQGTVDDYVVTDGLFGTQFMYNRFVDGSQ